MNVSTILSLIVATVAVFNRTTRLAACNQAVVILRGTSYIEIELNVLFEVVRNSIESMHVCSVYSAFDCISWNRLLEINVSVYFP